MISPKGFTLIELLLGLIIFSIVALSLYSTFAQGIKLNRKAESVNKIFRDIRWTMNQMVADLEKMAPFDFSKTNSEQLAFLGKLDQLSFILPSPTGLQVVSYYLQRPEDVHIHKIIIGEKSKKNIAVVIQNEEESKPQYLIREEHPFVDHLQTNLTLNGDQEILSTQVKEGGLKFSYAYLDTKTEDKQIIWQDQWSKPYLPFGVRVQITFLNTDPSEKEVVVQRDILVPIGFWGQEE